MTRADYIKVAEGIWAQVQQWPERGTHWHMAKAIAETLADSFAKDNHRFNRATFLAACGF